MASAWEPHVVSGYCTGSTKSISTIPESSNDARWSGGLHRETGNEKASGSEARVLYRRSVQCTIPIISGYLYKNCSKSHRWCLTEPACEWQTYLTPNPTILTPTLCYFPVVLIVMCIRKAVSVLDHWFLLCIKCPFCRHLFFCFRIINLSFS